MEEGKRWACGECDCPQARLVLTNELAHNSGLARDLKSNEVLITQKNESDEPGDSAGVSTTPADYVGVMPS